jgi:CheY-like chemotaxis protein
VCCAHVFAPKTSDLPNVLGGRRFRSSIGCVSRPGAQPVHILVYSSNARTREQVRLALGKRIHPELPDLTYTDVATGPMVIQLMDAGGFDLVILDGEASPVGGMGIAKQLKDEIDNCPPVVVLTGRADDAWLAGWSRAEAAVPHPIDPIRLSDAVVGVLRTAVR